MRREEIPHHLLPLCHPTLNTNTFSFLSVFSFHLFSLSLFLPWRRDGDGGCIEKKKKNTSGGEMLIDAVTEKEKRVIGGVALAGLKRIGVPHRQRRRRSKKKKGVTVIRGKGRVKDKLMDIWQKMIFPVRRVWLALSARIKSRKNGAGLLKLQDDVQTCGYEDIQVMWEMLQKTESEVIDNNHKRKQLPFWRVFVWSNQNEASSESANHT